MIGVTIVGIGFDFGSLFSTAGQMGAGIYQNYEQQSAASDAASAENAKLKAVVDADTALTTAAWTAAASADLAKLSPAQADQAQADQMVLDSARQADDRAAAALPPSKVQGRIDAAQKSVSQAQDNLQRMLRGKDPSMKKVAQYRLKAAQDTLALAQGGSADDGSGKGKKGKGTDVGDSSGESFWSKPLVGPVKRWHGAAALALGVGSYGLLKLRR